MVYFKMAYIGRLWGGGNASSVQQCKNNPNKSLRVRRGFLKPHEYLACPHVKYMTLCKDQAKEVRDFFLIYGPSDGLFIAEQLCGKIHPLQNVIVHQAV